MTTQLRNTGQLAGLTFMVAVALILGACTAESPSPTPAEPTDPTETIDATETSDATSGPAGPQPLPEPEQTSISFALSADDPANYAAMQLALDAGIFEKYGLDVEGVFLEGTTPTTQALLGGQVEAASNSASQTVQSLATDTPLVDVAMMINRLPDYLYGAPGIETADDLRGQRVAISQFGGQSHGGVVTALAELGLSSEDVEIVQIGGQGDRLAALQAGSVQAAPADPSLEAELTEAGFNVLVDLRQAETCFAASQVQFRRDWVEENPNTTLRVVAASLEAMQLVFSDLDQVIELYAAWAQTSVEDSRNLWESWAESGIAQRNLRTSPAAYEPVREILLTINPEVADVDVSLAWDGSFLDQLEDMGYFEALGVPEGEEAGATC